MFRLYFVNFGYYAADTYPTLAMAVTGARANGFEASVYQGSTLVGSWSIFSGYREVR